MNAGDLVNTLIEEYGEFVSLFFFFQAEDGIRDYKVTGVQTWLFRSVEADRGARRRPLRALRSRPRPCRAERPLRAGARRRHARAGADRLARVRDGGGARPGIGPGVAPEAPRPRLRRLTLAVLQPTWPGTRPAARGDRVVLRGAAADDRGHAVGRLRGERLHGGGFSGALPP